MDEFETDMLWLYNKWLDHLEINNDRSYISAVHILPLIDTPGSIYTEINDPGKVIGYLTACVDWTSFCEYDSLEEQYKIISTYTTFHDLLK